MRLLKETNDTVQGVVEMTIEEAIKDKESKYYLCTTCNICDELKYIPIEYIINNYTDTCNLCKNEFN